MLQEVVYLSTLSVHLLCGFLPPLSSSACLSVCLSVCLCLSLSLCLSVCLSACVCLCLSLSICLSICLSVSACVCLCPSLYLCLSVCLCLFVCLSVCLCLSVYLLCCCWPPCLAVPVGQTGSGSVQWPGYHTRTVHSSGRSPVIKSHVVDLTFSLTKKSCFFKINSHSRLY